MASSKEKARGNNLMSGWLRNDLAEQQPRPLTLKARRDAWRQWPTPARPSIQIHSIGTSSNCKLHYIVRDTQYVA